MKFDIAVWSKKNLIKRRKVGWSMLITKKLFSKIYKQFFPLPSSTRFKYIRMNDREKRFIDELSMKKYVHKIESENILLLVVCWMSFSIKLVYATRERKGSKSMTFASWEVEVIMSLIRIYLDSSDQYPKQISSRKL